MNKLLFSSFFVLCSNILANAQTADEMLEKYYAAIEQIQNISYTTHRIDTFTTGKVIKSTGYCILKRGKSKSLSGFLFKGKREDMDRINIFNGFQFYTLYTKTKKYTIDTLSTQHGTRQIIGKTGGQMIFQEMVLKDFGYNKLTYSRTDSSYILRFEWPDNPTFQIENRFKELHIDKDTYLPFYSYHYLKGFGEKQVTIFRLTDISMNDPEFKDPFLTAEVPDDYDLIKPQDPVESRDENIYKLTNKKAPDFELQDLDKISSRLSDNKGKVILLDFWEIWCGPCIGSIPKLNELLKKYPADQFEIWGIVNDSSTFSKVRTVVERTKINYRIFYGNKNLATQYSVHGVPLYVLVDPNGIITHAQYGISSKLEEKLDSIIH
jgi:thiol-disulfide isomerase/thioredoxin